MFIDSAFRIVNEAPLLVFGVIVKLYEFRSNIGSLSFISMIATVT